MVNQEMQKLGENSSVIRELFEYGKTRKNEIGEDKVFDFSIGNPNVPAPKIVNDTLIDLINSNDPVKLHGYTSAAGDINVRRKIADYLNDKYNTEIEGELIYLTAGAAASLTISLNALLNIGDEVIVFAPYFPEYKVFIEKAGGIIKIVKPMENNFTPDLDNFESLINYKTKAIIINSPNNPTGVIFKENIIQNICDILNKKSQEYKKNIYLISDEPYRELIYDDIKYPFVTNYYDNAIVCYSFSKSLSLPGERIGYIIISKKLKAATEVYHAICGAGRALGFVCAPSLFQYMIPKCLGFTADLDVYRKNRNLLYNALISFGYEVVRPEGAFYLFVKALGSSAINFSNIAKKYELLLVPSDSFGYEGYVRISYCVSTKQIQKSLGAFKNLIDDFKE